jgi:hypothetical protein
MKAPHQMGATLVRSRIKGKTDSIGSKAANAAIAFSPQCQLWVCITKTNQSRETATAQIHLDKLQPAKGMATLVRTRIE